MEFIIDSVMALACIYLGGIAIGNAIASYKKQHYTVFGIDVMCVTMCIITIMGLTFKNMLH